MYDLYYVYIVNDAVNAAKIVGHKTVVINTAQEQHIIICIRSDKRSNTCSIFIYIVYDNTCSWPRSENTIIKANVFYSRQRKVRPWYLSDKIINLLFKIMWKYCRWIIHILIRVKTCNVPVNNLFFFIYLYVYYVIIIICIFLSYSVQTSRVSAPPLPANA